MGLAAAGGWAGDLAEFSAVSYADFQRIYFESAHLLFVQLVRCSGRYHPLAFTSAYAANSAVTG